ncbi:MAG: cysteine desulfurase, partial [Coriobacteriaceae bacterium]|nr:cysteine desulfurase [Coriobacteriaceae bacterium]
APGAEFEHGGNANSLHSVGRKAFSALEDARARVARSVGAGRPDDIVFTSGATEANNAAVKGIVAACTKRAVQQGRRGFVPHLIASAIEHDSVLAPVRELKAQGCEATLLKPDRNGFITPAAFQAALRENTVLASVQMANNEVGTIQPIGELAAIAHGAGALFHADAAQALGKIAIDLHGIGVDAASFSAHKAGGPQGTGALFLKARTPFEAFLTGGGQEQGRRSGTQNICGAVGFAAACEAARAMQEQECRRQTALRDRLYERLAAHDCVMPSVAVEPGSARFLPNVVNVCVAGFESETLILKLDRAGFAVAGGSACSSQSLKPSHVLRALGISDDRALGSLRVSWGRSTTAADIDAFTTAFFACLAAGGRSAAWSS